MSSDNTRDWPSFTDILDELNALGPAQKQDPILMRHLGPQRVADASTNESASAVERVELPVEAEGGVPVESEAVAPVEPTPVADLQLPAELEPSDIDTAPLDEAYVPAVDDSIELDTSALEPVEAHEVALEDIEPQTDAPDVAEPAETIDAVSVDNPFEGDPPPDADASFEPIDNPFATDDAAGGVDPITGEIDWSTWDGAPAVQAEATPLGDFSFNDTPDEPLAEASPPPPAADATKDELPTWSATADGEDASEPQPAFDSVATADAIENDLQELFELDQVTEENNVVPLHPSSDDHSDAVVGLDAVFDQDAADAEPLQEWVGIKPEELRPADPWAHMRPDEDVDVKSGFWNNRKKFFGGDERRAKRAERDAASRDVPPPAEPTGPPCPNCSSPGHIDLQDPVGGKLHLSCSSCDQVWAVRYDGDGEQKSA